MARTKGGEMKKKEKLKTHFTWLSNGKVISQFPEKSLKNKEGQDTLKKTIDLPTRARKKWRPVFSCKKHISLLWERVMMYLQIWHTSQAPIVALKTFENKEKFSQVQKNIKQEQQIVHERRPDKITSDQEIEIVVQSEEAICCVLTSPGVFIFHFVGTTIPRKIRFFWQDIIFSAGIIFAVAGLVKCS